MQLPLREVLQEVIRYDRERNEPYNMPVIIRSMLRSAVSSVNLKALYLNLFTGCGQI